MSRETVKALQAPFETSHGLLRRFIEVCPAEIWEKKFGGWPVWQQVYHALGAIDFFTIGANLPETPGLAAPGVGHLSEQGSSPIPQAAMQEYAAKMEDKARAFFDKLSDADLPQVNRPISEAMGREATYAGTLGLIAGHALYHLGSCDAALRESGLEGVF